LPLVGGELRLSTANQRRRRDRDARTGEYAVAFVCDGTDESTGQALRRGDATIRGQQESRCHENRAPTPSSDGLPLYFDAHLTLSLDREAIIRPRRVPERTLIAVRAPTHEAGTGDKNLNGAEMPGVPPGV
jgi:hypothetical protein